MASSADIPAPHDGGPSSGAKPGPETAPPGTAEPKTGTATATATVTETETETHAGRATPPLATDHHDHDVELDFDGAVDTNHDLPTPETLRKIDKYVVLDRDGRSHTFRSLYTGRHVARRVLIIFVRHFFCGNCQDYLRTLSESVTPQALLALPQPTFIAVVGCGDPGLISMYADATACPFPIYTDPTGRLYGELGMVRTLSPGSRPAYVRSHPLRSGAQSVLQGLRQIPRGLALKSGDQKQVGGEFLFEPVALLGGLRGRQDDEVVSPTTAEVQKALLATSTTTAHDGEQQQQQKEKEKQQEEQKKRAPGRSESSLDGKGEADEGEDKVVTWCHRMRTTRDHAEVPELMEVLGLDGHGRPVEDRERWERALRERKGTWASFVGKGKGAKGQVMKG